MDWFLYDNGLRHERVKLSFKTHIKLPFAEKHENNGRFHVKTGEREIY